MNKEKQNNPSKIINFLFYKDGKFDILKTVRNILLIYILPYIMWFYSDFSRNGYNCLDCGLPIFLMGGFCYGITFIIFILSLIHPKRKIFSNIINFCKILLFLVILYFYKELIIECGTPICLLNIIAFPPVFFSFILIFKKMKYFSLLLTIIFLIPATIIITDDALSLPTKENCEISLQEITFNPIELPQKYFHQDGNKWVPNIVIDPIKFSRKYENKIIYIPCPKFDRTKEIEDYQQNNIVLCYIKKGFGFTITQLQKGYTNRTLVNLFFKNKSRKNNDLDVILGTKQGSYSCSIKLSKKALLTSISTEYYLKPMQSN